jgi:hypothetical protein
MVSVVVLTVMVMVDHDDGEYCQDTRRKEAAVVMVVVVVRCACHVTRRADLKMRTK